MHAITQWQRTGYLVCDPEAPSCTMCGMAACCCECDTAPDTVKHRKYREHLGIDPWTGLRGDRSLLLYKIRTWFADWLAPDY